MKILITGAGGFVGKILARALAGSKDVEIFGTYRSSRPGDDFPGRLVKVSLDDYDQTYCAISDIRPDAVYHLAAVSFMPDAVNDRISAYRSNVNGTLNLLESLASLAPHSKTLLASSSEVYGRVDPAENPISESRPADPVNAYSTSKYCAEAIARQYAHNPGLHVVIARPFNHTGPGQDTRFVAPAFASQIARIEAGLSDPVIRTGSLDAERDFCDVRDVAAVYPLILSKGETGGVYHVCSGRPIKIKWILDTLLGLSTRRGLRSELDPARSRPSENPIVFGDVAKTFQLTRWTPQIPMDKTLSDLLENFRNVVSREKITG